VIYLVEPSKNLKGDVKLVYVKWNINSGFFLAAGGSISALQTLPPA